jgi:hypothetical protein
MAKFSNSGEFVDAYRNLIEEHSTLNRETEMRIIVKGKDDKWVICMSNGELTFENGNLIISCEGSESWHLEIEPQLQTSV